MRWLASLVMWLCAAGLAPSAALAQAPAAAQTSEQLGYKWERLTEHAAFPEGYNFPVIVAPGGRFMALFQGAWESSDGATWSRSALPSSGMNSAFMKYVVHDGAIFALGKHSGEGFSITVDPVIQRTRDYQTWEQLGRSSTMPKRFFFGAASFKGWIWIVGGRAGFFQDAGLWRSRDAMTWEKVRSTPFGARDRPQVIVFKDRLWIIGGGGRGAVWSSTDGTDWREETRSLSNPESFGYSAVVFDDRLWLVGANRSGGFSNEMLMSEDGRRWTPVSAPWSPRGAVATWSDGEALYLTGGKYSRPRPGGGQEFIYSNDVWRMTRQR